MNNFVIFCEILCTVPSLVLSGTLQHHNLLRVNYNYPQQPVYQDGLPNSYLPPSQPPVLDGFNPPTSNLPLYPPINVPNNDIQPPIVSENDDTIVVEVPSMAPPFYLPPPQSQFPHSNSGDFSNKFSLKVSNLSCTDNFDELSRFHAQFSVSNFMKLSPSMEGRPSCLELISDSIFRINLEGVKVRQCGIKRCIDQKRICANIRMASVRGLRLPEDLTISLQCIPTPSIISHTKEIGFRLQNNQQRSLGRNVAVANSAHKKLEMKLNLMRKSPSSNFDEIVQADSPVFLGEELQLKVIVKQGNGWFYTKMDNVVMKSVVSQKSAVLIDENGCVNPDMRNVCPDEPQQVTPLLIVLPFRAFLFQGTEQADEMVLSVRMIGCVHSKDCLQQPSQCDGIKSVTYGSKNRIVRSVSKRKDEDVQDIELRFKVLPYSKLRNERNDDLKENEYVSMENIVSLTSIALFSTLILIAIFVFITFKIVK